MFKSKKNRLIYILAAITLSCYLIAGVLVKIYWQQNHLTIKPKMVKIYKRQMIDLKNINTLRIENCAADVVFKTISGDSAICILSGELGPKHLPYYKLITEVADSLLTIGTPPFEKVPVPLLTIFDENISLDYNLKLEIGIPSSFNKKIVLNNSTDTRMDKLTLKQLRVAINSGDFKADSLWIDKLEIGQSSGDLDINYLKSAQIDHKSASGSVSLNTLLCDSLTMSSSSGDIKIKELTGRTAQIYGSDCDLEIENAKSNLKVSFSSGDINIGSLEQNAEISASSGDIKIGLNLKTDFKLTAEATSGSVNCNHYPITIEEKSDNRFLGYHGNSAAVIKLGTTSGDISVDE